MSQGLTDEYELEKVKYHTEDLQQQQEENIFCKTKYPILLVHGVFFRDSRFFNYWGRIPQSLMENGATIYYGEQESAASIEHSAQDLMTRVEEIVQSTGCEKVNIIAHSKGGLDTRYAISCLGMDKYVASLTTINTPHKGCLFADYLLNILPSKVTNKLASTYNNTLKKFGDKNPDFIAALNDLTEMRCSQLNEQAKDMDGIFYQSVGSKVNKANGGKFPLNFSYLIVRFFEGDNDGLVSLESAKWGNYFTMISVNGDKGVSHGDIIDLNRNDIDGFEVKDFYIWLVNGLKNRGL